VNIVYNKDTDESMTYGFVRYQNPSDAIVAMSELNGREIFGKRIKVGFARPGIDTTNCKLYVKRVPPSYTLDDVHSLFSQVRPLPPLASASAYLSPLPLLLDLT
jgi:RNA recognition motif-containing protein